LGGGPSPSGRWDVHRASAPRSPLAFDDFAPRFGECAAASTKRRRRSTKAERVGPDRRESVRR